MPRHRGRNVKIDHGWSKIALVPRIRGRNEINCPRLGRHCGGAPNPGQARKYVTTEGPNWRGG
ncbi:MAG: hypothetical protein QM296_10640, partial [Bacillota bacterium]|nr:hypothetical protein [Bacillota bacterium]